MVHRRRSSLLARPTSWIDRFVTSLLEKIADCASVANAQVRMRMLADVPLSVRLRGRIFIRGGGRLTLGEGVSVTGDIVPVEMHTREKGTIRIGDRTFINYGTSISARSSVQIGADCHLGHYTQIMDNAEHGLVDRFELPPTGPVVIEDSVWIGSRVVILPGVRIGSGAVIGAGSIVTRNIPPRCVVAGNPARALRNLADQDEPGCAPTIVAAPIH